MSNARNDLLLDLVKINNPAYSGGTSQNELLAELYSQSVGGYSLQDSDTRNGLLIKINMNVGNSVFDGEPRNSLWSKLSTLPFETGYTRNDYIQNIIDNGGITPPISCDGTWVYAETWDYNEVWCYGFSFGGEFTSEFA